MVEQETGKDRYAFFSVHDDAKDEGLLDFARGLLATGNWRFIASGGTKTFLADKGGFEVIDFADMLIEAFVRQAMAGGITFSEKPEDVPLMIKRMRERGMDFGAIMHHKVVTLSRELGAMLLGDDSPEEVADREKLFVPRVDLLYCCFYPLQRAIATPGITWDEVVKQTDIGGPNMAREAAKGGRIAICDQADLPVVLEQLRQGGIERKTLMRLQAKAEGTVGQYCTASAMYHYDLAAA